MMVLESELRKKEVINVLDGRRMGFICDTEIDLSNGCICAIFTPGPSKLFGFLRGDRRDYRIPWNCINKIGDDVILVSLDGAFFRRFEETHG